VISRVAAVVAGLLLATAVAAPALAQQRAPGLVPDPASVEGGLWGVMERTERDAKNSADLNTDPALNDYVRSVACSVATEYCGEIRIYIMDRPALNASMAPNGYMEVWSGLLLRAENEAQLAFVLGHELGHFIENHSLEQWNNQKAWATAAMVITVGAGVAGAYYGVDTSAIGDLAYLTAVASVMNYSRSQETQADAIGFERMVAAGLEPTAAAAIWRQQQAETRASSFRSVRQREAMGSVFRTHPLTAERIAALDALAKEHPGGREERERYRAAIRPQLAAWLAEDLSRRDFNASLALTERLERDGLDLGVLEFHRGQILRQRRDAGDLELARDAYLTATQYEDAPVAAWRELGDLQSRLGEPQAAAAAWRTYLDRAATADDRWIVEDSLTALEPKS
jgi:predicted Zn-dependent protease